MNKELLKNEGLELEVLKSKNWQEVYKKLSNSDTCFLVSECNTGEILIEILSWLLEPIVEKYGDNQLEYEWYSFQAITRLYGVVGIAGKASKIRESVYGAFKAKYVELYQEKMRWLFLGNVKFVIDKNIVERQDSLIFSRWLFPAIGQVKRSDFQLSDISTLASRGEKLFLSHQVETFPVIDFLQLRSSQS